MNSASNWTLVDHENNFLMDLVIDALECGEPVPSMKLVANVTKFTDEMTSPSHPELEQRSVARS